MREPFYFPTFAKIQNRNRMEDSSPKKTFTRPEFSASEASELLEKVWGLKATSLAPLPSYDDLNYKVDLSDGRRVVFKAFHAEENTSVLLLQDSVMRQLSEASVRSPSPVLNLKGETFARHGKHLVRVLDWVPGSDWIHLDEEARIRTMPEMGALVARVDAALSSVEDAAAHRHWVWRTSDALLLREFRWSVEKRQSAQRLALFDHLLAEYETTVIPQLEQCGAGVIHNDINDHNTLVEDGRVVGVIDLGDVCFERYCFSLGNTLFYALMGLAQERVLECAQEVLRGYLEQRRLSSLEQELVWTGACLRCLVSCAMAGHTSELHPHDAYVGETEVPGWKLLEFMTQHKPF